MNEEININRINGIIAELQRQNQALTARCAELSGTIEELNSKLKATTSEVPDEAA